MTHPFGYLELSSNKAADKLSTRSSNETIRLKSIAHTERILAVGL